MQQLEQKCELLNLDSTFFFFLLFNIFDTSHRKFLSKNHRKGAIICYKYDFKIYLSNHSTLLSLASSNQLEVTSWNAIWRNAKPHSDSIRKRSVIDQQCLPWIWNQKMVSGMLHTGHPRSKSQSFSSAYHVIFHGREREQKGIGRTARDLESDYILMRPS